jgi:hypothetical protein
MKGGFDQITVRRVITGDTTTIWPEKMPKVAQIMDMTLSSYNLPLDDQRFERRNPAFILGHHLQTL